MALPTWTPLMRSTLAVALVLVSASAARAQVPDEADPRLRPIQPLRAAQHPAVELDRLAPLLDGDAPYSQLHRAAELTLDLAMLAEEDPGRQVDLLVEAESYARRALELRPDALDTRFLVGAAIGMRVEHMGSRDKMKAAEEVRQIADGILDRDPEHVGGLHLIGRLNAAAMRMNALERFLGRMLLGASLLGAASWDEAERCFRAAVRAEPSNPAHRWELALLLLDTGREAEARAELARVLALGGPGPILAWFRDRAQERLERLDG